MAGVIEVMARLTGNSSGMVAAFAEGSRAAQGFEHTVDNANRRAVDSHDKAAKAIKGAAIVAAAAIGGVGLVATDMAADFEKSTMRLKTSGGMTRDTMEIVKDGILEISKATGFTAMELADGMFTVSAAGYNTAKGLDILRAAAQGAAAEGTDLTVMVSALTTIMSTYNLKEEQVVGTTNQLVTASGLAKGTMQDFSGSLATVLPVSAAAGISFADVAAAIAVMTNKGVTAQEATQQLRNAITNLQAPNQVAVKMMAQLGISSKDVSLMLGKVGLAGTLEYLSTKVLSSTQDGMVLLGTMKKSEAAGKAMQQMLGGMSGDLLTWSKKLMDGSMTASEYNKSIATLDVQGQSMGMQFLRLAKNSTGFSDALRSGSPASKTYVEVMEKMLGGHTGLQVALQLTGGSMGRYKENIDTITAATTKSTTEVYTNRDSQSTLAAQLARTKAEFGALMIELGEGLIPMMKDAAKAAVDVVHWFRENETAAKTIGIAIGGLVGFLTTYAAAQWIVNSAVMAFPGTWIVLALAGLAVAFTTAYEKVGWFRENVDRQFAQIRGFIDGFGKWFSGTLVPNFHKSIDQITGFFRDVETNVRTWKDNTVGMFTDFDKNTRGMIRDWSANTKGMFNDFFKKVADGWAGFCKDPIGETKKFFETISGQFAKWDKDTTKTVVDWVNRQVSEFQQWNRDASKNITTWLNALPGDMSRANNSATSNLKSTVQTHASNFQQWNREASKNITTWLQNVPANFQTFSRTASKTLTDFNASTLAGARGWVADNKRNFENWRNSLTGETRTLVDNCSRNWETFNRNTKGMFNDMFAHIGRWAENVKDSFGRTVTNIGRLWEGLRAVVRAPIAFVVNTVYNAGLRPVWNNIADKVGLGGLKLPEARFHTGGIMSGYNPGVDDRLIAVGGGEAVMRPEWTRAVGADRINAWNAQARAGRSIEGFASGGIAGGTGSLVGDILGNIGKFVAGAAGNVMSFLKDPLGGIRNSVVPMVQSLVSQAPGGSLGQMVGAFPLRIIDGLGKQAVAAAAGALAALIPKGPVAGSLGPGGWMHPAPGTFVSQPFHAGHNGVDLAGPLGGPILAAQNGRVSHARWSPYGGGNEIHIDHPGGVQTWYAHLNRILVGEGQNVLRGRRIGDLGTTGNSTGPHLHFMMLNGGWPNVFNPMPSIGLNTGGIVPKFDRGGTLSRGLNVVDNSTGSPEPLTPLNTDLADKIAAAITEALQGASFDFNTDGLSSHVAGKLVLASQRRAGRG